ncbi:MAG: hypothetical protein WC461_01860 [Candidatus Paceibacterota bacterium]
MNGTVERGPAHVVIPKKIGQVVEKATELFKNEHPDNIQGAILIGALLFGTQILKEMVIPEKEADGVMKKLREIHAACSPEVTRQMFLSAILLAPDIVPSATTNKDNPIIDIGPDLGTKGTKIDTHA